MKKLNGLCARTILLAALAALVAALQPVLAQSEPTIDKTSVQVTTQEHRSLLREPARRVHRPLIRTGFPA